MKTLAIGIWGRDMEYRLDGKKADIVLRDDIEKIIKEENIDRSRFQFILLEHSIINGSKQHSALSCKSEFI